MKYTTDEIQALVSARSFWYHKINLNGVITPGYNLDPLWSMIRKIRSSVNYQGKAVLDLASFDGMWAFEAEGAGASSVTATDIFGSDALCFAGQFLRARCCLITTFLLIIFSIALMLLCIVTARGVMDSISYKTLA